MGNIFTSRFLLAIAAVFVVSSALSQAFLSGEPDHSRKPVTNERKTDAVIDQALEFSLNGAYDKSFPILKHLADRNVTRAKLYLAVAYYHGHGVKRNKQKARDLFMELQEKGYETGIVSTYLSLIGYSEI